MFRDANGRVRVGAFSCSAAEFAAIEQGYTGLPEGVIERRYAPAAPDGKPQHVIIMAGPRQTGGPVPWPEGDAILAKEADYPGLLEAAFPPPAPSKATLRVRAEGVRDEKLAAGFDYDFADVRGIHRFGTTEKDRRGWDEVKAIADAAMQVSNPTLEIGIRTDTGDTTIAAQEWPAIMLAGAAALQPVWQASWAVKDDIDSGAVTDFAGVEGHAAWPA